MEEIEADTGRTPRAIETQGNVSPHLGFYWDSFKVLSSSRHSGMNGAQAINMSEISAYCDLIGLKSQSCRIDMLEIIHAMDVVFLELMLERIE